MSNKYPGGFVSLGGQVPSYSNLFSGSNYLSTGSSANLQPGSSDFCVEAWVYPTTVDGTLRWIYQANDVTAGTNLEFRLFFSTSGVFAYYYSTSGYLSQLTTATPFVANKWSHVAWSRSGSTISLFVNGNRVATGSISGGSSASTAYVNIGQNLTSGGGYFAGNISNLRFVKGSSIYTPSNTTLPIPTGPFTAVTNTQLLTCQSATIVDNSSNAFTITNTGTVTVSNIQPDFQAYNPNNLDPALGAATPGVWTLSQALQAEVTRSWPMYDPYYKNVVLNLHGEGTNGAQNNTFLDSSSNAFTITRNGNTTQGSFSPYGNGWSNSFVGTSYLTTSSTSVFNVGTGNFTVECWIFPTAITANTLIFIGYGAGGTGGIGIGFQTTGLWGIVQSGVAWGLTTSTMPVLNQWNHIVACRGGTGSNQTALFLNGVRVATGTYSTNFSATSSYGVGWDGSNTVYAGYISNLRVNTTDVYGYNNTAITVPTAQLSAITGTVFLTCQSNRFVDNSASPLTITTGGTPSVQRFQPFLFNTSYTPSTIGGSGYFDGTGDYLNTASTSAFAFGTGDFTIESWVYLTSDPGSGGMQIVDFRTSNTLTIVLSNTGSGIYVDYYNGSFITSSAGYIKVNSWAHVAVVRSSGTTNIYINGVSRGSASDSVNFSASSQIYVGMKYNNTQYIQGYMSDVRVVKGTAITPSVGGPTSPLTAVTNTQLLCNMTNGGIYDNAMMNDLETVGNAQISTSVKKYGTGSMSFNGTTDYLKAPTNRALTDFYTGDFTIEAWIYFNAVSGTYQTLGAVWLQTNSYGWIIQARSTDVLFGYGNVGASAASVTFSWSPSTSTWYHFAITRSGSSVRAFINGTQIGSTQSISSSIQAGTQLLIGANQDGGLSQYWNGYIDDLRITKGVARYVANFTPPTSQLQDQ